ncbi:hypothetical protein RUND412_005954 [Rhizina undulata]
MSNRVLTLWIWQWNRLIGGSGSSTASHKLPPPATPQQRLARFKRVWQSLLHSWRNTRENDPNSQDQLQVQIKRLTDLLIEEEKRSARLCMNFCYEQQVFIALSKIGQYGSPAVVRECIAAFSTLMENEDEDFLAQESFAQSLIEFLRATSHRSSQMFEGEFVELLFGIAAKIRLNPEILGVWFTSSRIEEGRFENLGAQQKFAGITNKEEFPLFYLLIDFVHHEGRVGDFARTGLLYIIEAASYSVDLERWIVESDLATLMASGLGALYSQLSRLYTKVPRSGYSTLTSECRKLVVTYPTDDPPTILMLSDYSSSSPAFGAESSNSPEFQTHLETFLSYLIFWQDVLEHCKSVEVKQTLLDHFQVLFLQQLLYPSLLESSDIDGGSSVAVLTYVRVILDTLEHPDIIHLILSYLMALPEKPKAPTSVPSSPMMARRRKSLDLLSKATELDDKPTPDLFNLVDLVLTSLKSKSQQTVSATLRLVSTILRKHHQYSVSTLLKVQDVPAEAPARTVGAHNKEIEMFFQLVTDISGDKNATASYEDHLKDNLVLLESHPCSAKMLDLKNSYGGRHEQSHPAAGKVDIFSHTIHPNDPLLRSVVDLLGTFFSNTVETNLILTCVVVDLATCSWMRPEGWLLFDPVCYEFENSDDEDDDDEGIDDMEIELAEIMGVAREEDILADRERKRIKALKNARREPKFTKTPPILTALQNLVLQIQAYKKEIPDLDDKLAERRRAFEFTDELNEALLSSPLSQGTGTAAAMAAAAIVPAAAAPAQAGSMRTQVLESIAPRNLVKPSASSNVSIPQRDRQVSGSSGHSTPGAWTGSRVPARGIVSTTPSSRGISPAAAAATASPASPFGSHVADTTTRRIKALQPGQSSLHLPPPPEADAEGKSEVATTLAAALEGVGAVGPEFTLSHLLTNIMILQEFILEIAALTQVRASLFGDVKFA